MADLNFIKDFDKLSHDICRGKTKLCEVIDELQG